MSAEKKQRIYNLTAFHILIDKQPFPISIRSVFKFAGYRSLSAQVVEMG